MKRNILILLVFAVLLLASFATVPAVQANSGPVLAQTDPYGLGEAADTAQLPKNANFPRTVGIILFTAISLIGVFFLVLMVYGGFLWMTAGGNSEKTKKAAAIMRNGAIGVVIILSAYAITKFVIIDILVGTSNDGTGTGTGNDGGSLPAEMRLHQLVTDPDLNKILN